MGIKGLLSHLNGMNLIHKVDVNTEVKNFKRNKPDDDAIVVIDFFNVAYTLATIDKAEVICGGRHQNILALCEKVWSSLKNAGCKLIFFSDLGIKDDKIPTWLSKRDEEFKTNISFYHEITGKAQLRNITSVKSQSLKSSIGGIEVAAKRYGEFYYSTEYENDLGLALYAMKHNALAVISNDTDFLIFEGSWKLWSIDGIDLSSINKLTLNEYDRCGFKEAHGLTVYQLPIFATLLGNDFTKSFHKHRNDFCRVAEDVRNMFCEQNYNYPDELIKRINQYFPNGPNQCNMNLIRKSLKSYDISAIQTSNDHPMIEKQLWQTNKEMYRFYMMIMSPIQAIPLYFYDMQNEMQGKNLYLLILRWIQCKIGVVRQRNEDAKDSYEFTLLAKEHAQTNYDEHKVKPIYPEFPIPPLDDLYLTPINQNNSEKSKIFKWIMNFDTHDMEVIKKLPKKYLLTCTVLNALVKGKLISVDEADGILYTEIMVNDEQTKNINVSSTMTLTPNYVRAAHIYNITFPHVRENFSIAGLLPLVENIALQFDGVYYQKHMEEKRDTRRNAYIEKINEDYRIYAKNNL